MSGGTVYIRYTNRKTKASHVRWHQTWDRDLFVDALAKRLKKEKSDETIKVISEEEYRDDKWGTKWRRQN